MDGCVCVCVLCGLPAAGKSTLGRRVSALAAERGWRSSIMHYDDLIPEYAFRVTASEDNTQAQTDWKLCRQSLLQCIENFLRNPRVPSDPPDPGRVNDDAWRRCIRDALLGEEEEEVQPSPMLLLLDDNFYYPSMRYEVYQLARKCSLGFCQVFLDCSVQSCTRRNQERANPLPTDVILEMSKRLEPPNPQKNPWEINSITLNNSEHLSEMEIQRWMELITHAFHNPLAPVVEENTEQKEADRLRCATSMVHQADQACRRLVSAAMKSARGRKLHETHRKSRTSTYDGVPPEQMKCLAHELNESKVRFLRDLRTRCVQELSALEGEDIDVQRVVTHAVVGYDAEIKETLLRFSGKITGM